MQIFKDGKKTTRERALKKGMHLVSVLWVESCRQSGKRVSEDLFPVMVPGEAVTPLMVGRLKRTKSMQPKAFEEDVQNSAGRCGLAMQNLEIWLPLRQCVEQGGCNVNSGLCFAEDWDCYWFLPFLWASSWASLIILSQWEKKDFRIMRPQVCQSFNYMIVLILKSRVEKGHKWLFLTNLCFSWFKMDPACPSYHCWLTFSPRTLFRRRTLGLAARKMAKPPFFQIGT